MASKAVGSILPEGRYISLTRKRHEDYSNMVQRLYAGDDISVNHALCRNITFQVTSGCNLRCSYCYEHHKGAEHMSIETGRKIVDYLLDLYEQGDSDFINRNTRAVVLDFIGGEPLLEASLIEKSVIIGLRNAGGAKFLWRHLPEYPLLRMESSGSALKRGTFLTSTTK